MKQTTVCSYFMNFLQDIRIKDEGLNLQHFDVLYFLYGAIVVYVRKCVFC